ncbi:MAG: histidinol-phosphate transaminase [Legionellales bacterium]|nr:histidinol-phosphate transaminase [Legionellales bacterium]
MKVTALIRKDLQDFTHYASARRQAKQGTVWLNANELPWDVSQAQLNRYPTGQPEQAKQCLANYYDISPQHLLITRGSDEGIDLIIRLSCQAYQDRVLILQPTFSMYAFYATLQAATVDTYQLSPDDGFTVDVDRVVQNIQPNTKVIVLCSPNNPTGHCIPLITIKALAKRCTDQCIVLVDEAYIEFCETDSAVTLIEQCPNIIVLRTLSKAFGLAGLRCGVVLAQPALIDWLSKLLAPYPLSSLIEPHIVQALQPKRLTAMQQQVNQIKHAREQLASQLTTLSMIQTVYPSFANFLLVRWRQAGNIYDACQQHGVILRDVSSFPGLTDCLRISIGTEMENQTLLQVLIDYGRWQDE